MHVPDVELHEAETLDDAARLVSTYAPEARLVAGGTDVLVDLKTGRYDVRHIVSLHGIDRLRGVERDGQRLRIGAMTTLAELDRSPELDDEFEILRDATSRMAALQIRNTATVGGNVAGAVPCADLPPVLMVLNAELEIWSPSGERTEPLQRCLIGPRETTLAHEDIVTAILVPKPPDSPDHFGAAYERFSLREGNAIAVASVAAGVVFDTEGTVSRARLALGAVAPMPKLVGEIEGFLPGRRLDDDTLDRAAESAMKAAEPISDIRGTAEFRRDLVGILTRRALIKAKQRSERQTK